MKIRYSLIFLLVIQFNISEAQNKYSFILDIPVYDYPENKVLPYRFPSMNQALEWSTDMYEIAFWGIDEAGDLILNPEKNPTRIRNAGNILFKYVVGLAFSKYGSELPVPLGVWAHEEFHRSVLGIRDIGLENGNWLFSRWDGTVYGIGDETLNMLKENDLAHLLYSYVSGVQYELLSNKKISLSGFYSKRSFPRAPLVLYNSYYVWNYFRFSASSASDSAKVLAPPHEDADPMKRDFTGADLNAWVYDMFNPDIPFTSRDPFPGGNGINRRIGFSDLSPQERDYLREQKQLSILNFLNPAILLIDRIKISDKFAFNFFAQYIPVHFGNSIGLYLPLKIRNTGYLFSIHRYRNYVMDGYGLGFGISDMKLAGRIFSDIEVNLWDQPESFFIRSKTTGGSMGINLKLYITDNTSVYLNGAGKTEGWLIGNPYLNDNFNISAGLDFRLVKN